MSSQQKTVLIINESSHHDTTGGTESYVRELIPQLKAGGYQVITLSRARKKDSPVLEVIDDVKTYRYRGPQIGKPWYLLHPLWSMYGSIKLIRRIYRENTIDIISAHHTFPMTGVLTCTEARRTPLVYTLHAPTGLEIGVKFRGRLVSRAAPMIHLLERRLLRHASLVITLSRFMADKAVEMLKVPRSKLKVIPGGVNLDRFLPPGDDRLSLRNKYGYQDDELIFITVRRLTARMGIPNLLAALERVLPGTPKLRAVIAGKGELYESLKAQIENSPILKGKVNLTGYLSDGQLADYYRFCDLFVLPTAELEGFGLATLEAMASGIPVIATPVGGSVEILENFDPSLLFQSASSEDIGAGLQRMYGRLMVERGLGEKCRKYVEDNYDWKKIGRIICEEQDHLIASS